MSAGLVLAAVALPFLGAVLVVICGRWPNVRELVSLAIGGALCLVVWSLASQIGTQTPTSVNLIEVMPRLWLALAPEPLGVIFALVASTLWVVTTVYSIGYMRGHGEVQQTRFYAFFALSIGAVMGIAMAANMFTLFVFYELLTLTTYPLVTHHRTPEARKAGRIYLGVLFGTSIGLLLLGMAWTWQIAGSLDFVPGGILAGKADNALVGILLALYAFGIGKAALMPFHLWLPAAMVAPTPVSALLHAVAVVKAGVFALLKVVVYIFGIDLLHSTGASDWLVYASGLTILLASLIALSKDNLKARLAYSTISQLSYIILGAALANDRSITGSGIHIAAHAFGKITLFFSAGAVYVAAHKTEISDMKGLGRRMPLTFAAFFVASLSMIGLPPFVGAWSKWYLLLGSLEAGQFFAVAVLAASSLFNIAYLLPIPINGFFAAPSSDDHTDEVKEAPLACLIPLLLTAAACLALSIFADPIIDLAGLKRE